MKFYKNNKYFYSHRNTEDGNHERGTKAYLGHRPFGNKRGARLIPIEPPHEEMSEKVSEYEASLEEEPMPERDSMSEQEALAEQEDSSNNRAQLPRISKKCL